jgi:TolA-binding protein
MKTFPFVLAVLSLASAAGAVTALCLRPPSAGAHAPQGASPGAPDTAALMREVQAGQAELRDELRAMRGRLDMLEQGAARRAEQVAVVETAPSAAVAPPSASPASAESKDGKLTVEGVLADLFDPELDETARQELWQKAREAGLLDDLVKEFEARAAREPNNPDRKVELAHAYVQKIFEAGNGPLAGVWATKVDQTLDQALELDSHHWDARFSKAVGLSFWPPVFGKQGEAIAQFETLVAQQEAGPSKPKFAETYVLLGNLYQQSGKSEQALATWQKGVALFPENPELLAQLKTYQKN